MILDACLFRDETEMLELRLRTLEQVVDTFVVVHCARTHQGQERDVATPWADAAGVAYGLGLHESRFAQHLVEPRMFIERDGTTYHRRASERGAAGSPWYQHIERQHRDGVVAAVYEAGADDEDIVFVSDVDEIPHPQEMLAVQHTLYDHLAHKPICLPMRMHAFALDLRHPQSPWWATTVSRAADCRPQTHRDWRSQLDYPHRAQIAPHPCEVGGVHLSWMGTPEQRDLKLATFSHAELADLDLRKCEAEELDPNAFPLHALHGDEITALWWPDPMRSGSFGIPESWWRDSDNAEFVKR